MNKWYVGVDGGGTKTAIGVSLRDGKPLKVILRKGCSYQAVGIDAAVSLIVEGIKECLKSVGAELNECAGCCLGIPCYGENTQQDIIMANALKKALLPVPLYIVNDVEVGWAGALDGKEGIHIVAGTGAIAFGKGMDGNTARCGGWNEFFGDEGSAYWIGRETMSLFAKEADGRLPQGPLYEIVRKNLNISDDMRFIDVVINELAPYRDKVAAFQIYANEAVKQGDMAVAALYEKAASELALMVVALRKKLLLPDRTNVSYSGGLFQVGNLLLEPLRKKISVYNCILRQPVKTALEGALKLSIEQFRQIGG